MIKIAIHGGAGTIEPHMLTPEKESLYKMGLQNALDRGYEILAGGGTSLDAITTSIQMLEDNPLFNAGKGAVYNYKGGHDMDASIMEGKSLMAGAVSGITRVKNPITLAKTIMQKSEHVYLSGIEAEVFAKLHDIALENTDYFDDAFRRQQWETAQKEGGVFLDHMDEKKFGTVGAVALDQFGNIAAGTSTGGMTNKRYGRIGDTPIIGAGTYANNKTCAISCTGHGEYFIRAVVAYDISCLMEYKGFTLKQACDEVVMNKLVQMGGEGGLIALDAKGNIELSFNSSGMYRGVREENGNNFTAIYREI